MIQLFLMPLNLIWQNLQAKEFDQRAKNDYRINCKAEEEIQEVNAALSNLKHLDVSKGVQISPGKRH